MIVRVCPTRGRKLTSVYKQQRARQLNDGTFERRTHEGVEGDAGKKGELFGLKNIFRYCPEGFVAQNVCQGVVHS